MLVATLAAIAQRLANTPHFWNLFPCWVDRCCGISEVFAPVREMTVKRKMKEMCIAASGTHCDVTRIMQHDVS